MRKPIIDVHIDSLHVGHKTGLYYDSPSYDHKASKSQRWLWSCWELLWDKVEALKKEHKAYLHVSVLGEAADIDYRNRSGQFWTKNYLLAMKNAIDVLERPANLADTIHFFRGTEAHVGDEGTIDELVADNFDNTVPTAEGRPAHAHTTYELNGVLFDVAHHGVGKSKFGRNNLANNARDKYVITRASHHERIADIIARGHNHWQGSSDQDTWPLWVQTPPFQLPYEFIYRIDPYVEMPDIGAAIYICKDGKVEYEGMKYEYERTPAWQPK